MRAAISSTAGRMRLPPLVWMYFADLRNQIDLRLHVPRELAIDLLEVVANRLEDLRERER